MFELIPDVMIDKLERHEKVFLAIVIIVAIVTVSMILGGFIYLIRR